MAYRLVRTLVYKVDPNLNNPTLTLALAIANALTLGLALTLTLNPALTKP